ncbi:MAG TPA: serine/threonine-protein kinase, partial [Gemmataceae bacterium]|nr:serine/threonine-protein kinase [Gemmataceae bacterium]
AALLDDEGRRAAKALRATVPDLPAFAEELARRGHLTPLQARWVGRGDGEHLLIGPYVVRDRLGAGGMGEVFLARHRLLARSAAVKVIRPEKVGRGPVQERFLREVRATARMDHPHVVHALDAGFDHGQYWLALEYVPGPDLARLVREAGPLPAAEACRYAGEAARGLGYIHDQGVVHRDVKPANLALDKSGRVKVLDVGLASGRGVRADGDAELTRADRFLGSADFGAPEQVEDARRAGPAADQYALGATLYFLLTGQPPFPNGTPVQRALARMVADPVPVETLRPGIPTAVARVVHRLMARRPGDRFENLDEAAAALEEGEAVARTSTETTQGWPLALAETCRD